MCVRERERSQKQTRILSLTLTLTIQYLRYTLQHPIRPRVARSIVYLNVFIGTRWVVGGRRAAGGTSWSIWHLARTVRAQYITRDDTPCARSFTGRRATVPGVVSPLKCPRSAGGSEKTTTGVGRFEPCEPEVGTPAWSKFLRSHAFTSPSVAPLV